MWAQSSYPQKRQRVDLYPIGHFKGRWSRAAQEEERVGA